jgi:hypothetical protein
MLGFPDDSRQRFVGNIGLTGPDEGKGEDRGVPTVNLADQQVINDPRHDVLVGDRDPGEASDRVRVPRRHT